MLKLSMKVLIIDNEENSLTALRIIFDLHKSFRPSLENQVQVSVMQADRDLALLPPIISILLIINFNLLIICLNSPF